MLQKVISRASLVPKSSYNILLPLLEDGIDINSPDELNPLEDSMLLWKATLSQAPNHLVLLLQFQSPRENIMQYNVNVRKPKPLLLLQDLLIA